VNEWPTPDEITKWRVKPGDVLLVKVSVHDSEVFERWAELFRAEIRRLLPGVKTIVVSSGVDFEVVQEETAP